MEGDIIKACMNPKHAEFETNSFNFSIHLIKVLIFVGIYMTNVMQTPHGKPHFVMFA